MLLLYNLRHGKNVHVNVKYPVGFLLFFGDYLGGGSRSLLPTILAIMMTLVGGFLAFTGIILDSMTRMINRVVNDPEGFPTDGSCCISANFFPASGVMD